MYVNGKKGKEKARAYSLCYNVPSNNLLIIMVVFHSQSSFTTHPLIQWIFIGL